MTKKVLSKVSSSELLQQIVDDNKELKNEIVLLKDSITRQRFQRQKTSSDLTQNFVSKKDNFIQKEDLEERSSLEASREKINNIISNKSKRIIELEEKSKNQESSISEMLFQKEAIKKLIDIKNEQIILQKSDIAELHSDKLKLKQEINSLILEIRKVKSKELFHAKQFEQINTDVQNQRAQFEFLFNKNVGELKDKDTKILSLGQEIISLKNKLNVFLSENENLRTKLSSKREANSLGTSMKITELEDKLKSKDEELLNLRSQNESLKKIMDEKNEQFILQKSDIATLHSDKLKLKQENDSLLMKARTVRGKDIVSTNMVEKLQNDIKLQKETFDSLFAKNIEELKEKDTQLLSKGQELIKLKNTIDELSSQNKLLQSKISLQKDTYDKLKSQMHSIGNMFVSKDVEIKTIITSLQSELEKYKKITAELQINNQELLLDVNKYSNQMNKYKKKTEELELSFNKRKENMQLDVVGREQLSIHAYNQNKEIEILKQTILELTHKLKTRKVDEANMLNVKDQEFDIRLKQLTEEHSKKEIELEYKLEDLRKENQALRSDMELLKQKGQQMLESIKNQFNTLL